MVQYLAQWKDETPSIEKLIGEYPGTKKPKQQISVIDEWKKQAKEKGLKTGGGDSIGSR